MTTPVQISGTEAAQFQREPEPAQDRTITAPTPHWSPALRVAFRFCFVYFTVYSLSNQIISGLLESRKYRFPDLSIHWPLRQATLWAAAHVRLVAGRRHSVLPTPPGFFNGSGSNSQVAVTKILEQFPQDCNLRCKDSGLSQDVFLLTQ